MTPAVCVACGESLDRDAHDCRFCGQDNRDDTSPTARIEIDDDTVRVLDRLQPWSRIKHEIIDKYLSSYTTILKGQTSIKRYVYIDAFAGAGVAVEPSTEDLAFAGAARALQVEPPFSEYHFIERDPLKLSVLREVARLRPNAHVHEGDYRDHLVKLLARCRYEQFARALCLLDPYGLSVDYELIEKIGQMRSVEIFFNFMIMGANRNVLWADPSKVSDSRRALMTKVWGTENWPDDVYQRQAGFFGDEIVKGSNDHVIEAYRKRLKAAGFKYVPEPVAMRNSMNAPVYYLFFCSPSSTGHKIVDQIFARYR
ncbi:MAG: three-Cys-motif partner protein TcmP [Vicinamibacterales bacterium]